MALASLAVVIPVYNRESIVLETLESVLAQTVSPDKVIIIDDGSEDNSYQVIENWLIKNKLDKQQWILYRQKNQGVSAARNTAQEFVIGIELIAFLDSDDLWPKDYIERVLIHFNNSIIALSAHILKVTLNNHRLVNEELVKLVVNQNSFKFLKYNFPYLSGTVLRKNVLDNIGWFEPNLKYGEDHVLWLLVADQGQWGVLPGKPFMYRAFVDPTILHVSQQSHLKSRLLCAKILDKRLNSCDKYAIYAKWKTWYSAARQLEKRERKLFARPYYKMALKYRPYSVKTLLHLLKCYI